MLSPSFISGAIAGVAGLAAATFIDHKITESKFSPELKTPEGLDAAHVTSELNSYYFKGLALISKCNKIELENSNLIVASVSLPWDNPLQKAANAIGGKLAKVCRASGVSQLLACKKEAENVYGRYLGIFERANALLAERGRSPLPVAKRLFSVENVKLNCSVENEDWHEDFDKLADHIRDTIDQSCELAQQLIETLEQDKPIGALEAANN